jgi:hypothetical protein
MKRKRWLGRLKVFSICLVLFFLLQNILEQSVSAEGFQEGISRFNPMEQILSPLEEAVPGLDIKGFLRFRPRLDLHGNSDDVGPGISKHYDFSMLEWLAELEVRYDISPDLQLVNINNFLYDAFFDWEDSAGSWRKEPYRSTRRYRQYYRTDKQVLRELYLDWYIGDWWLRMGKQQIAWGKMLSKHIDIINPEYEWSGGFGFDTSLNFEYTRITTWMLNATYYFGESYFQFIWIPDFEPSGDIPTAREGNPFGAMVPPPSESIESRQGPADKPSASFLNHEFGLNFNTLLGRWDISLFYFDHWDDRPTSFRQGFILERDIDPETGLPAEKEIHYLERKHTRLHTFGAAMDVNWWALDRNWAGRIEGNYTLNDYVGQTGQLLSQPGVTKRNWLSTAYNISTSFFNGELSTALQITYNRTFGWDENLRGTRSGNDRQDLFVYALSLSKKFAFTNDRLGVTFIHAYTEDGDMRERFDLTYQISDYLSFLGRMLLFNGNSNDRWGQSRDKDTLHFELRYTF